MPYCPNCAFEVDVGAISCPRCDASFEGKISWKPLAQPRVALSVGRERSDPSGYDDDEYAELIGKVSRHPLSPRVGLPIFSALFLTALLAKNIFEMQYAGLLLILLLLVFPYYLVQLLMQWSMRRHRQLLLGSGRRPSYVPSNARSWAAVYIGAFFLSTYVVIVLDKLTSR